MRPVPEGSQSREPSVSRLEVALAIAWVLLGLVLVVLAFQIRIPAIADPIGPRTLPVLVGVMLSMLGLVVGVRAVRGGVDRMELSAGDEEEDLDSSPEPRRVLLSIGIMVGYLVAMPLVGFIAATVIAGAALMWVQGARGIVVVALPAALAAVVFLTFSTLLNVRFP